MLFFFKFFYLFLLFSPTPPGFEMLYPRLSLHLLPHWNDWDGWGNVSAASLVFDVAAAIQTKHMCAGRPSLAHTRTHTWERATVNHVCVCVCESVSGFEQRRVCCVFGGWMAWTDGRTQGEEFGAASPSLFLHNVKLRRERQERRREEGKKEGGRKEEGGGRLRGPREEPRLTAARARLIFTLGCLYF